MIHFLSETSLLVLTCIHEEIGRFVDHLVPWLAEDGDSEWSTARGPLDLARVYAVRPPCGGANPLLAVMWTPSARTGWTAFFVNSEDGWSHLFAKLAQAGGPEMVNIRSSLPVEMWGVQEFAYWEQGCGCYDTTRLLRWLEGEDGYELLELGNPLPFEASIARKSNPIATRADLVSFLRAFGIDVDDDRFWRTDGDAVYLSQRWLPVTDA